MTFIVAQTYMCAMRIARRAGLQGPQDMTWLTSNSMMKLRGMETPTVWIADCGWRLMDDVDKDMIRSRRPVLSEVTCDVHE